MTRQLLFSALLKKRLQVSVRPSMHSPIFLFIEEMICLQFTWLKSQITNLLNYLSMDRSFFLQLSLCCFVNNFVFVSVERQMILLLFACEWLPIVKNKLQTTMIDYQKKSTRKSMNKTIHMHTYINKKLLFFSNKK